MEMTPISRRKVNIERLSYQPSKPYHYDLEIFRVSNLKRRTRAEAMHWTYSYEFYMLICITQGRCIQLLDFEPDEENMRTAVDGKSLDAGKIEKLDL